MAEHPPGRDLAEEGGPGHDASPIRTRPTASRCRSRISSLGGSRKYVAEIWWRIGDWEFDQRDLGGGVVKDEPAAVYDYNRAASAYMHALERKTPMSQLQPNEFNLRTASLYKYAWTLFKQQRYEAAVQEFVQVLHYTDERAEDAGSGR